MTNIFQMTTPDCVLPDPSYKLSFVFTGCRWREAEVPVLREAEVPVLREAEVLLLHNPTDCGLVSVISKEIIGVHQICYHCYFVEYQHF